MVEEQDGNSHAANTYHISVFLISAYIPLAEASLMAKIMVKELKSIFHPQWEEKGNEYLVNSNLIIVFISEENVGMFEENPEG